jgi:hypothetical protein
MINIYKTRVYLLFHRGTNVAVPWLRRLVPGLLPRRPEFAPGSVHVAFVVDNVVLGQVSFRVLRFPPVNIIPPWLFILTYHLEDEQQARWWPQFRDMTRTLVTYLKSKVKQSLYTPWRRLGGQEV